MAGTVSQQFAAGGACATRASRFCFTLLELCCCFTFRRLSAFRDALEWIAKSDDYSSADVLDFMEQDHAHDWVDTRALWHASAGISRSSQDFLVHCATMPAPQCHANAWAYFGLTRCTRLSTPSRPSPGPSSACCSSCPYVTHQIVAVCVLFCSSGCVVIAQASAKGGYPAVDAAVQPRTLWLLAACVQQVFLMVYYFNNEVRRWRDMCEHVWRTQALVESIGLVMSGLEPCTRDSEQTEHRFRVYRHLNTAHVMQYCVARLQGCLHHEKQGDDAPLRQSLRHAAYRSCMLMLAHGTGQRHALANARSQVDELLAKRCGWREVEARTESIADGGRTNSTPWIERRLEHAPGTLVRAHAPVALLLQSHAHGFTNAQMQP